MRREREAFIRKQKAAAEQYCTLMKETVERKIAEEEKKGAHPLQSAYLYRKHLPVVYRWSHHCTC